MKIYVEVIEALDIFDVFLRADNAVFVVIGKGRAVAVALTRYIKADIADSDNAAARRRDYAVVRHSAEPSLIAAVIASAVIGDLCIIGLKGKNLGSIVIKGYSLRIHISTSTPIVPHFFPIVNNPNSENLT